jgi:hypothetical protein
MGGPIVPWLPGDCDPCHQVHKSGTLYSDAILKNLQSWRAFQKTEMYLRGLRYAV